MGHSENWNQTAVKGIAFLWVTQEKEMCSAHHPNVTPPLELVIKAAIKRHNNERGGLRGNSNVWSYIGSSFETKPWWLSVLWLRSLNILISRSQFSFHDAGEAAINYPKNSAATCFAQCLEGFQRQHLAGGVCDDHHRKRSVLTSIFSWNCSKQK